MVSVLLAVTSTCLGHIALTYPPARIYAIDFLNSMRTVPPCGMAKGSSAVLRFYGNYGNFTLCQLR